MRRFGYPFHGHDALSKGKAAVSAGELKKWAVLGIGFTADNALSKGKAAVSAGSRKKCAVLGSRFTATMPYPRAKPL